MHKKPFDPKIWIIEEDLSESAKELTNEYLSKSIDSMVQILMVTRYYFSGIHTNSVFKQLFSKENKADTISKFFPELEDLKVSYKFSLYTHKAAKWARKCGENYRYLCNYLEICLNEYYWRMHRPHRKSEIADRLLNASVVNIPLANISKVQLDWKLIPLKYRNKDIIKAYRDYYAHRIQDPLNDYVGSNRDIPSFFKLNLL